MKHRDGTTASQDMATAGGITRRKLLVQSLMGGAAAAMGLGGMGGAAWAQATSGEPTRGEPTRGGNLAWMVTAEPASYDPLVGLQSFVINVLAPCYNNLVRYDPFAPTEVIGDLAESWEVSEDGTTYTFKLKSGVVWHDGQPFTAADVKHTFDTLRAPPEGVISIRQNLLAAVSSIDVVDDLTVQFVLSRPQRAFLQIMAIGWMIVLPKHVMEAKGSMADDIVGTGPFRFVSHDVGVSIQLERNPDYHVEGLPYLDGMTIYVIPDRNAGFNYLRAGQLHLLDGITTEDGRRAEAEFGDVVDVQTVQSYTFASLTLNTKREPWNDPRVRQAVSLAIDRREALQVLRQGDGVIGGLMPPGQWSLSEEALAAVPGYGTDIEASRAEARRLLADAGFADGLTTTITTRTGATFEAAAIFIQDQLRRVGIDATLQPQETATFEDNLARRNFDLSPYSRTIYVNDADAVFPDFYACGAQMNLSSLCNEQLDALLEQQGQAQDDTERLRLVNEMDAMGLTDAGEIVLYWRDRCLAHSVKMHDFSLHPEPENNRRMAEVWLSA